MESFESLEHLVANRERLAAIVTRLKEMRTSLINLPPTEQREDVLKSNQTTLDIMERMLSHTDEEIKAKTQEKSRNKN
jgi:hypothetical protein